MASQIFIVATIGGRSSELIRRLFLKWEAAKREAPDESGVLIPGVDAFCDVLRSNRTQLPILYYTEWVDRWQMGDDASPSGWVCGSRFQACCLSREEVAGLPVTKGQQ